MMDIREIYQELLLDHNKNPRNFYRMEDADMSLLGHNPLCGDRYTIYLKMRDGIVSEVSFEGEGCAISKASASLMTEVVKGKTKEEALALFEQFHQLVTGELNLDETLITLGKLAAFSGIRELPMRVKCAILPWHTLKALLTDSKDGYVSTE
jgi:nitrogen fixation NifU-like protein